jgi:hypothetical protein
MQANGWSAVEHAREAGGLPVQRKMNDAVVMLVSAVGPLLMTVSGDGLTAPAGTATAFRTASGRCQRQDAQYPAGPNRPVHASAFLAHTLTPSRSGRSIAATTGRRPGSALDPT